MVIIAACTASKKPNSAARRDSSWRAAARPNTRAKNTTEAIEPSAAALIGLGGTNERSQSVRGGEGGSGAPPWADARSAVIAGSRRRPEGDQSWRGDAPMIPDASRRPRKVARLRAATPPA